MSPLTLGRRACNRCNHYQEYCLRICAANEVHAPTLILSCRHLRQFFERGLPFFVVHLSPPPTSIRAFTAQSRGSRSASFLAALSLGQL
jgi:hypothetical protein